MQNTGTLVKENVSSRMIEDDIERVNPKNAEILK